MIYLVVKEGVLTHRHLGPADRTLEEEVAPTTDSTTVMFLALGAVASLVHQLVLLHELDCVLLCSYEIMQ